VGTTSEAYAAMDVAYETASGRALLVYALNSGSGAQDFAYRTWDGSIWSAATIVNDPSTGANIDIGYLRLASNPSSTSNDIALAYIDTDSGDARAWIWNGSAFTNPANITTAISITTEEAIAVAYEQLSKRALFAAGTGTTVAYRRWNGTTWDVTGSIDINTGSAQTTNWLTMKSDPVSNKIMLLGVDVGNDLSTGLWSGSAWGTLTVHDAGVDTDATRPADFEWEQTGSKGLIVWGTAAGQLAYRTYNAGFGVQASAATGDGQTHRWVILRRVGNTLTDTKILGAFQATTTTAVGTLIWRGSGSPAVSSTGLSATNGNADVLAFDIQPAKFPPLAMNDPFYPLTNCSVYIDGSIAGSNASEVLLERQNTITVNPVNEGFRSWYVRCEDRDGTGNSSRTSTLRVDRTAPNMTLTVPSNASNLTISNILFAFTPRDNMAPSMTCNLSLDGIANITSFSANNNTNTTRTINGVPDGLHNWSATCIDLAGNVNTSINFTFFTGAPPNVTLLSPPNNGYNNTEPLLLLYNVSKAGIIANCTLFFDDIQNATNVTALNNGGRNNFTLLSVPEGLHSWFITCPDVGGLVGNSTKRNVTIDRTAPNVSLNSPYNGQTVRSTVVTVNWTAIDNTMASLSCRVTRKGPDTAGATTGIIASQNGTPTTYTYSGLPDGQHFWNVTCADSATNSNFSVTWGFNISGLPSVTLISPPNNNINNSQDMSLVYVPYQSAGINNCTLFLDDIENETDTTIQNNANNMFNLTLADGKYNWSVNCSDTFDGSQNSATRIFTIDTINPTINLTSPDFDAIVTNNSVVFNYTPYDERTPPLICNLTVNGTVYSPSSSVNNATPKITTVSLRGNNASYMWNVTCRDQAGNYNTSETRQFNIIAPPNVTLITPPNYQVLFENGTFVYRPLDNYGIANCSLVIDDIVVNVSTTVTNNTNNNLSASGIGAGAHNWTILCYDNDTEYFAPTPRYFSSDGTPPFVFLVTPDDGIYNESGNMTFNWTTYDDFSSAMTCRVVIDNVSRATNITANNTYGTSSVAAIADGVRTWQVNCTDQVGNQNQSDTRQLTINQTPFVTQSGPADNNITNNASVMFRFTVSDNDGFANCSILIGGVLNTTNQTPIRSGLNNISINFTTGFYNWSVMCYDNGTYKNQNSTGNRSIAVNTILPIVTLNAPPPGTISNYSHILFNWTAIDALGFNLSCNIIVNGTIKANGVNTASGADTIRNVTGLNDSYQVWNVTCIDAAGNTNTSTTYDFTITEPPIIALNNPSQALRTSNATINFTFTPTDNSGLYTSCSLIIDGVVNATSNAIRNAVVNNITMTGFTNGTYLWSVNCTDIYSNTGNSTTRTLYVDQLPPAITLTYPPHLASTLADVVFNWTAHDSGTVIRCNLTLDGVVNASDIPGTSGAPFTQPVYNISQGPHSWNVTCWDDLQQSNISETYNFTVSAADLVVNESVRIRFNNTNPDENNSINVSVNVSNTGGVPATNAIIAFFDESPAGILTAIGNVTVTIPPNQSRVVSVPWNITLGFHTIWAMANPDLAIYEDDVTNNNVSKNISVLRVFFNSPLNATMTNNQTPGINFTIQNFTGGEFTYKIYVDNTLNGQTGTTIDNESIFLQLNALGEGIHRIIVQANDTNKTKNSTALTITIDTTAPNATFITRNGTFFRQNPFNITINITDRFDSQLNYTVYVDGIANTTGYANNATPLNVTLDDFSVGAYNLTIEAYDDAGNIANSTNITIYIDNIPPHITLNSPADGANFTTRSVFLNYTPTDNLDPIIMCNVTLDGAVLASYSNITNGANGNVTANNLVEGTHYWNATCWDGLNAVMQVNSVNTSETRTFSVYIPPALIAISPPNNTLTNNDTRDFIFNVSDETGLSNCSLIINGIINVTLSSAQITNNATNNITVTGLNNSINWSIRCIDNSSGLATNTTGTYNLTVDTTSPNVSIITPDGTWFNVANPGININATDNYAWIINTSFFVDGEINVNATASNGALTTTALIGIQNGTHTLIVQATDSAGNKANSSQITFYVDTMAPIVTLLYPPNATNLSQTVATLNFTAYDNIATVLLCNLTLDGLVVAQFNLTNNTNASFTTPSLAPGYHYWNATCVDNATNRGRSETWQFYIELPDLVITTADIVFSNYTPVENQTIIVNATVFNLGLLNATNVTVQFWRGDPSAGGTILLNVTIPNLGIGENVTINLTNYTTIIGLNQLYVLVDPPIATNGSIRESNETNNIAHNDVNVGLFEVFAGGQAGILRIADVGIISAYEWNQSEITGSNVFVTDTESAINFNNLQAIGLNRTNGTNVGTNDFVEIDTALGTSTLNDSVNRTYTVSGNPLGYMNLTAFKKRIDFVPIINSTNTTSFVTGILWDTTGGANAYSGTQPILFVSVMNQSQQGKYGIYDYEIAIPAKLRDYVAGGGTVTFYTELR